MRHRSYGHNKTSPPRPLPSCQSRSATTS